MQVTSQWCRSGPTCVTKRVFAVNQHSLTPVPHIPIQWSINIHPVIIRQVTQNGSSKFTRIGTPVADLRFALQYRWKDEVEFFNTSTSHLRSIQITPEGLPHKRVRQWQTLFRVDLHLPSLWRETWIPMRSSTENCFLWQLIYRVPATQHWRFPDLPPTDCRTWCTRCEMNVMEDIVHCIWQCPISRETWRWVNYLLSISMPLGDRSPLIRSAHVFVALGFPYNSGIPKTLWTILRAATAWHIWKNRCTHYMEGTPSQAATIIHKVWSRLRIYLRQSWISLTQKIRRGQLTQEDAIAHMSRSFGSNPDVWAIHEHRLQVPPVPPRPP